MADITEAELHKLAALSRLRFEGEKLAAFKAQFASILGFVDQLKQLDTTDIEPLTTTVASTANLPSTPEREDKVTATNQREALQRSAVRAEHGFYVVPRVME